MRSTRDIKITHYVRRFQGDAHDLKSWPEGGPSFQVRDENGAALRQEEGKLVIEKVPCTPSVLMLNPAGHEVRLPVRNGSGKPTANDPYQQLILPEKMEKGFLPKGNCPRQLGLNKQLHHEFPQELRDSAPCMVAEDGNAITVKNPCKCYLVERELRRAANRLTMSVHERRRETMDAKDRKIREQQAAASADGLAAIAEVMKDIRDNRSANEDAMKAEIEELRAQLEAVTAKKGKK
jgi:hypothetical protein